jgi:light-regulated signal transduction histidine kinase (bacteriophytochrome)
MINTTLEKNSHCFEWEFLNADNNPFFASIMLSKIDIDNKTIFQASIRDITNRKRINEMLEKKQKDLKSILNAAPVGMLLINNDMVIKQANNAILDLLGRDYKHVLKQKAGKALGCKNIPIDKDECGHTLKCKNCKLRQTVQNVLNTKESVQGLETKITLNANGKDVTVHINLSVEPIMLNNKTHAILAVNDITERKLAEKRQGKLLEELESANRELKDFAYIVSHDLKAPLRGIRTLADWLMTDYAEKLGTDAKDQFDLLLKRVTRMHNLIEGILQYSRVGRIKEEKTEIDVNELVKNAIDMIDPPENIEISVEDQMPVLKGQTTRLMQIFTNLISNAVKYMDKPNGSIRIGCIEEQDFWTFSVSDNGPGIEDKHFERIFQIFQTLTPRDQYESTGIGLTITKKIIELYGGRIWLQSVHGEGTTFFFTLPKSENELINTKKIEAITAC